jgi:hypothetical protein
MHNALHPGEKEGKQFLKEKYRLPLTRKRIGVIVESLLPEKSGRSAWRWDPSSQCATTRDRDNYVKVSPEVVLLHKPTLSSNHQISIHSIAGSDASQIMNKFPKMHS